MRSLFRQLPLDGAFDVQIEDFLFEPINTPLIPQTGQPIVNNQTNVGQTNQLTRTENALLSDPLDREIARRT